MAYESIKIALNDYENIRKETNGRTFRLVDVMDVYAVALERSGGKLVNSLIAISTGLEAGYVIGYRQALRQNHHEKTTPEGKL